MTLSNTNRFMAGFCVAGAAMLVATRSIQSAVGEGSPRQVKVGQVTLTATGLTKENEDKTRKALLDIVRRKPNEEEVRPVTEVAVELEAKTLAISFKSDLSLALSEVERALAGTGTLIDIKALALRRGDRLAVNGVRSPEAAKNLEKTLQNADLFQTVRVDYKEGENPATVMLGAPKEIEKPPMFVAIRTLIEQGDPAFKVTDVVWTGPTFPKSGR